MRHYRNFPEAQNEIKRDLAELGVEVHGETMQDKNIENDPDYFTRELTNYIYTVLDPDYTEIEGVHEEWVAQEWDDRIIGDLNPGRSWKVRKEVWNRFLERSPKNIPTFSYTYSQRMGGYHITRIIEELHLNPNSRQLWLPVWYPNDETRRGKRRVPCSLGYWFVMREKKLHMTYMMRSCDLYTHYANDIALAAMLLHYIAGQVEVPVGPLTHYVGSFHVYAKDVANVF